MSPAPCTPFSPTMVYSPAPPHPSLLHPRPARRPESLPTSERAIPVAIFSTEPSVARSYLRQWCGGDIGNSERWLAG